MRILIAGKFVPTGRNPIGGLQSWIKTVRVTLEDMGHTVVEWEPGMAEPMGRYDLGVLSNLRYTAHLRDLCDRSVCVSHGVIPDEKPMLGMHTFCVSEGVRDHWGGSGTILRQPVDLDFWQGTAQDRAGVVRYSYRTTPTHCEAAAKYIGMPFKHVQRVNHEGARESLSRARVVIATGRAALEAMACGTPTVIYDHRAAYQGPLMDGDLSRQMRNSYSGRGGVDPSVDDLAREIERVMLIPAERWRKWVVDFHDARKIVKELIA
jgi:glycosyltransferase involved in cell wall biosynthesis